MICFHPSCKNPATHERLVRREGSTQSLGHFCSDHPANPPPKPPPKVITVPEAVVDQQVDDDKKEAEVIVSGPGWLYDEHQGVYVQPASYEQRALFDKQGYVPHPLDWQTTKPRRLTIRHREPLKKRSR